MSLAAEFRAGRDATAIGRSRLSRAALTALSCAGLALLSCYLQGFQFGIDNNIFHIPITLHWYDLPQFAHDPVMQSLRRYATPVFPLLGLVANGANIATVFFAAFLLTRALTIAALIQLMRACGLRQPWLTAAAITAVFASAIYGQSMIGRDELLVGIFTHTALAQAVALMGIASLVRGRLTAAAIAAGAAFDLNIMVGVWTLAPLALACAAGLANKSRTGADVTRAILAFSVMALPVALWVGLSQKFGPVAFDYRAFLRDYYPYHFFIGWADWSQRTNFLVQLLSGLVAASLLRLNRANATLALLGLILVFGSGIAVGQVSHSRFLLNLHLLRVDGMLTWMVTALVLSAGFSALSKARLLPTIGGAGSVAGLIAADWWIVLSGLLILALLELTKADALRRPASPGGRAALMAAAAAAFVLTATTASYSSRPQPPGPGQVPSDQQLAGTQPASPEWRAVARWAEVATVPSAMFLVPPKLDFVVPRPDWISWKEGAAVMWAPEVHALWQTRSREVASLRTAGAILAYACHHGIDYVVFDRRPARALPGTDALRHAVFANRWFAVIPMAGCR